MKIIVVSALVLVCIAYAMAAEEKCPEDFCKTQKCSPVTCEANQIFVEKGGQCGCCDFCKKKLEFDEPCVPGWAGWSDSKCDKGLRCCGKLKKCVKQDDD